MFHDINWCWFTSLNYPFADHNVGITFYHKVLYKLRLTTLLRSTLIPLFQIINN